jgi:putative transposase
MDISRTIRSGRHCVFDMNVHLVFVTKYRKEVFNQQHLLFLEEVFSDVCEKFESTLLECNGEEDHVHLLLAYPPKVAVSKLVNSLKGASSRRLKNTFPGLQKKYWGAALWSPSYFAGSCGGAPISIIKEYIENQDSPKS